MGFCVILGFDERVLCTPKTHVLHGQAMPYYPGSFSIFSCFPDP